MRHTYFRFVLGILWLAAAVVCALRANISFAALYVVLGAGFLWSAYSISKKGNDKDGGR